MKREICIVCPKGCRLVIDEDNDFAVEGATCERGRRYGKAEAQNPVRFVTTTVKVHGGALPRCPVKSGGALPKALVGRAVRLLDGMELKAPVRIGDVVLRDVLGTGIDFVASRNMRKA